jgi:hypothetical protein
MANTFIKIASVTVGSGGAASVDFTSIPSTYTDLCLKMSLRASASFVYNYAWMTFNNDTAGSPYTIKVLYGEGTTAGSTGYATGNQPYMSGNLANYSTATSNTFGNSETYIPNYASTTNKSLSIDAVAENNATGPNGVFFTSALWVNASAINRITVVPVDAANFVQYSTATLYGIKKN